MISVRFIDWFGIKPIDNQAAPVATGAAAPYSSQVRCVATAVLDGATKYAWFFPEIAYAPLATQKLLMLQGWTPAAMLAANAMAQNDLVCKESFNAGLPLTPEEAVSSVILIWCLNFQQVGSQITTPRAVVSHGGKSTLIQSRSLSWAQALETFGNIKAFEGKTSEIKKYIQPTPASPTTIPNAIRNYNLSCLENKTVPNYSSFEISKNWDFWGKGWDEHKPENPWRIPVGSFLLKAKKNNVALVDNPTYKTKTKISIINKGETVTQTLPLDKNGYWGAADSNNKYGFVLGENVEIAPLPDPSPAENQEQAQQQAGSNPIVPKESEKKKSNFGIYVGIGASILILGGTLFFLRRK